jgi:hypothetical protein
MDTDNKVALAFVGILLIVIGIAVIELTGWLTLYMWLGVICILAGLAVIGLVVTSP